jgi:sodium/proline symporter
VWLLIGIGGAAFAWGLSAAWIWLALVCGFIVNGWYVGPRLRALSIREGSLTVTQLISVDVGDRMQPLVARSVIAIAAFALLLLAGAQLHFAGSVLKDTFGFDVATVVTFGTGLIVLSTMIGGYWAASMLDAVQTIVLLVTTLFLPFPALLFTEGWGQMSAGFAALGPQMSDMYGGRTGIVAFAFAVGVLAIGLAMPGQPHAVSRYMAARDETTMRVARWLSLVWIALLSAATLVCGWCAKVLYAGIERPEEALIAVATRLLPPWLGGAIALALALIVIAAIGSQLLVLASSVAVDIRRPGVPVVTTWVRGTLVVSGAFAVIVALYGSESILERASFAFAALGAAFGPLLLVRLTGKRVRPGSTLGAMWSGFVLTVVFHLLPDSPGDFLERVFPFIAALGIALTGGERRHNPDRADRAQETVHDRVPI